MPRFIEAPRALLTRTRHFRESFVPYTPDFVERQSKKIRAKLQPTVNLALTEINQEISLPDRVKAIRERVASGKSREIILPSILAAFSIASRERTGKTPYEKQLMGAAIAATEQAVVQMNTGEGKTISIAATAAVAAIETISGKSVHVVSPNDTLAELHCKEFAPVLRDLGIKTAFFKRKDPDKDEYSAFTFDPDTQEIREISIYEAYHGVPKGQDVETAEKYVIYGSHGSYIQHYLADRRRSKSARVQSDFDKSVAVVDEVDSIFIDAASTKRIVAKNVEMPDEEKDLYNWIDRISAKLEPCVALDPQDYQVIRNGNAVSKKHKNEDTEIILTPQGRAKIQEQFEKGFISSDAAKGLLEPRSLVKGQGYEIVGGSLITAGDYYFIDNGSLLSRPALTESGVGKIKLISETDSIQGIFGADIYEEEYSYLKPYFEFALLARGKIKRDEDYIVKDGGIVLIDSTTGRLMPDTHLQLLDHALLAKEGLLTKDHKIIETETTAAISIQRYFNQYSKISGFTATATPSAEEFDTIYKMHVYEVLPNSPSQRVDYKTEVYDSKENITFDNIEYGKNQIDAVALALERHKAGQPVLLATLTVEKAKLLKNLFNKDLIEAMIKDMERQAEGQETTLRESTLKKTEQLRNILTYLSADKIEPIVLHAGESQAEEEKIKIAGETGSIMIATNIAGRGTDIRTVGKLLVIGTELDRSQRISMQLRGRSGRNGKEGESVFLINSEDRFFDILKTRQDVKSKFDHLYDTEGADAAIEFVQSVYEQQDYEARLQMLKFEEVISYKEQDFQEERQSVIDRPREHIENIQKLVTERIREIIQQAQEEPDANAESVRKTIREIIPQKDILTDAVIEKLDLKNAKSRAIVKKAIKVRAKRLINSIGIGRLQQETILSMDNLWSNYVNSMTDAVFAAIGETPRGMDPLDTYRKKSGDLFELEKQSSRRGLADKLISLTPKQIIISPK